MLTINRLGRLLVLFALSVLVFACSEKSDTETPKVKIDPKWSAYVSSHTSGLVSSQAKVMVTFVNDVVSSDKVDQSANDVFKIDPEVSGVVVYASPREIVFLPNEQLASGQSFKVAIDTSKLQGFPSELDEFAFDFSVIKQNFEVLETQLSLSSDPETMILSGGIDTADIADADSVANLLSASYLDEKLEIEWQHAANGRNHEFLVKGIKRQKTSQDLMLSWNGTALGVANQGTKVIEIPAKGVFKVTGMRAIQSDTSSIEVQFSEPLDTRQDLTGLVQLSSGNFNTKIKGSALSVYPNNVVTGEVEVTLHEGIKNKLGLKLGEQVVRSVVFMSEKPRVRFVGKGVILPENEKLTVPFEAVNVDSVQVTAFRVFENNLGQFLQSNKLEGDSQINRVGRYLWQRTIPLGNVAVDKWTRYSLDVSDLLKQHPGGLFRLTVSINRSNSVFECSDEENAIPVQASDVFESADGYSEHQNSGWDGIESYYQNREEDWRDRKNPCKDAYYKYASDVRDSRNFMASNIGLVAKQGSTSKIFVTTTDIRSSEPLGGVGIKAYNFQNQVIGEGTTDNEGLAEISVVGKPFYLLADKDSDRGVLKMSGGNALATSHFDVGGEEVQRGVKGALYGERGVWRPGDKIFLTFVLQDKEDEIPDGHPVSVDLYNPKGQIVSSVTNSTPVGDFYRFELSTAEDAPTGVWHARARLGGMSFDKALKIETVVPNRLKVELGFGDQVLGKETMPLKGKLFGQWLHGAKASNLKADVKVRMNSVPTRFDRFKDYKFDDPSRTYSGESQTLFEGKLDSAGYATFEKTIAVGDDAPGMLRANFTSRIFEEGGGYSINTQSASFYPYENFVGVKLPKGDPARGMLLTDVKHKVDIATLSAKGEPSSVEKINVTLYKIDWKWWWDKSGDSLARYANSRYNQSVAKGTVSTVDGKGSWEFEVKYPSWGRYLLRACDEKGGHCSGQVLYIDWPGWAGRAQEEKGAGASALTLYTDKTKYTAGETAVVNLPAAKQGRALLSVENGSTVLQQRWMELADGQTSFELPITAEMSPNVYVSVLMVQPHAEKISDKPIRLYGIVPIFVEDPQTVLSPQLKAPAEMTPESTATVEVSEESGRAMTYTLAVVDEGLLGLTNYSTPDLHKRFYRREALGVRTWDIFDEVVNAYGGDLERLLALGGGEDASAKNKDKEKRRFPPVVRFLGPFELEPGEIREHKVDIPQYVGEVRLMLVAGHKGSYGRKEVSVPVRQPLTMLASLPRMLGPEEELDVPVTLFVMDPSIKKVDLQLKGSSHFEIGNGGKTSVEFQQTGDQLGFIPIKVREMLSQGELNFVATSGKHTTKQDVFIEVRSPNPPTTRVIKAAVEAGQTWSTDVVPHGLKGTNSTVVEVSAIPPMNLEHRLRYLVRYPHGCIEQTTSSVFPQVYLPDLVQLEKEQQQKVEKNVAAGIERIKSFQTPDGGLAYWPGGGESHPWGSNYGGHFLLEARRKGYQVPETLLADLLAFQKSQAGAWVSGNGTSQLDQAYRLYILALAGQPEIGAMNRLKSLDNLGNVARWQLASAYQLAGQKQAADDLIKLADYSADDYTRAGSTFGSRLRDKSIILLALAQRKEVHRAKELADEISTQLSSEEWFSTQSVAYALLAMARFIGEEGFSGEDRFELISPSGEQQIQLTKPIWEKPYSEFGDQGGKLTLNNTGGRTLYVTVLNEGIPHVGDEKAGANGLSITVKFTDTEGRALNVTRLPQGTDVRVEVKVKNLTDAKFENIALTQIIPSGWQIHNARFTEGAVQEDIDYQDIRDDRLLTYFELKSKEEKVFETLLNASYQGRFYLPGWLVEPMYDATKFARTKGQWVEVVR